MEIRKVGIVGAGAMGSGIAQVCAQTGWDTVLYDAFPESLKKGEESILSFWQRGIEKGKTSEVEVSSWKATLRTSSAIEEASTGMTPGKVTNSTVNVSVNYWHTSLTSIRKKFWEAMPFGFSVLACSHT